MGDQMAEAFAPFENYIECLARGDLDGYFTSILRDDKLLVPGIEMSTDPILLLHGIGDHCSMDRINELFSGGTVYFLSIFRIHGTR